MAKLSAIDCGVDGGVDHQLHLAGPDRVDAVRPAFQHLVDDRDRKTGVADARGGAAGGQ